jgi:isopentenyldiphosphate isomerase
LAFATAQYRRETGDYKEDEWFGEKPFAWLLHKLGEIGCNVLQERPTDQKPLPKPWTNPITNEPLPPPEGPDERAALERLDPELLRWFDEMKESPYKTVAAYRAAEAERQALGVIQYREAEHKLNPYLGKSETAKAHLAKRDPALAKFYERESNPVLLPLFGKNKDLTVSGKLVKDPFMSAIVKIAEQVHERWRTEDHQSAIAQRTAAEQALKRLESAA